MDIDTLLQFFGSKLGINPEKTRQEHLAELQEKNYPRDPSAYLNIGTLKPISESYDMLSDQPNFGDAPEKIRPLVNSITVDQNNPTPDYGGSAHVQPISNFPPVSGLRAAGNDDSAIAELAQQMANDQQQDRSNGAWAEYQTRPRSSALAAMKRRGY